MFDQYTPRVLVIGGGAAGMMAALFSARIGAHVLLIEKNEKLGKKIYITGKGRGNLTNTADREMFLSHVYRNPRFLYTAFSLLDNQATMSLFEELGLHLKIERGGRVFPSSDHASDITATLHKALLVNNVSIRLNSVAEKLLINPNGLCEGVLLSDGESLRADAVIIATGGLSYPSTGSTGDGYTFAKAVGHTLLNTSPALVPLETAETWPGFLSGLSLKNVRLDAFDCQHKKRFFSETGEMLLTHFGISGPLVLTMSSILPADVRGIPVQIDMKPALSESELDARILRDIASAPNKCMNTIMDGLAPHRLGAQILVLAGISGSLPTNALKAKDRHRLVSFLKGIPLTLSARRSYAEAIITRGGINTKEISPSTMGSKKIGGLYFAGEVLDLDASTGGYNMQIAFSTGALAGASAARYVLKKA